MFVRYFKRFIGAGSKRRDLLEVIESEDIVTVYDKLGSLVRYDKNNVNEVIQEFLDDKCVDKCILGKLTVASDTELEIRRYDAVVESTFDMILGESHWSQAALACFVLVLQLYVLMAILAENSGKGGVPFTFSLLIARIFVCVSLADEVSGDMNDLYAMKFNGNGSFVDHVESVGAYLGSIAFNFISGCLTMYWARARRMTVLNWSIVVDAVNNVLTLVAACVLVRSQRNTLQCLFNYGGLLVVSKLDNVVGKMLRKRVPRVILKIKGASDIPTLKTSVFYAISIVGFLIMMA